MIEFTDPWDQRIWISPPFIAVCEGAAYYSGIGHPNAKTAIYVDYQDQPLVVQDTVDVVMRKLANAGFTTWAE